MPQTLAQPLAARRISLATLTPLTVAATLIVALGVVITVATYASRTSLLEALGKENDNWVSMMSTRLADRLRGVEDLTRAVSADDGSGERARATALAATPMATDLRFFSTDATASNALSALHPDGRRVLSTPSLAPSGPFWSDAFFSPPLGRAVIQHIRPLANGGVVAASVDVATLSATLRDLADTLGHPTYLLDGRDRVLGHSALLDAPFSASAAAPLPQLDEIGDAAMAAFWRDDRQTVIAHEHMNDSDGHYFRMDGLWQVYIYGALKGFAPAPWTIGLTYDSATEGAEIRKFWTIFSCSLMLLGAFSIIGVWLGLRASRPLNALSANAVALQRMDFDSYRPPAPTRIAELDDASRALDGMAAALRVFARHLPAHIVERVVGGEAEEVAAERRRITVMITDIADFSALCARIDSTETAALLNAHFSYVGRAIERHGGFIDKFVGDGLMAFWGAPTDCPDQAASAVAAARAIQTAIEDANAIARAEGGQPILLRIGLHTGDALVGEIGAVRRMSYTAVGEAVDVAAQLEAAARRHAHRDVTVLISEDVYAELDDADGFEDLGEIALRGGQAPKRAYRL